MSLDKCGIVDLPKIGDNRGDLSFVEEFQHVPFRIRRVYFLYNIPLDATRGAHGHRTLEQLIVPISGSFDVTLDDGCAKKKFKLSNPGHGLYVSSLIWREIDNFSSNAVCLVLASDLYSEADYFRDYDDFISACGAR